MGDRLGFAGRFPGFGGRDRQHRRGGGQQDAVDDGLAFSPE
jgi:hypothetical protein